MPNIPAYYQSQYNTGFLRDAQHLCTVTVSKAVLTIKIKQ